MVESFVQCLVGPNYCTIMKSVFSRSSEVKAKQISSNCFWHLCSWTALKMSQLLRSIPLTSSHVRRMWWADGVGVREGCYTGSNCSLDVCLYRCHDKMEVKIFESRSLGMKLKIATKGRGRLSKCPPNTDRTLKTLHMSISISLSRSLSLVGDLNRETTVACKSDTEQNTDVNKIQNKWSRIKIKKKKMHLETKGMWSNVLHQPHLVQM